jgi:hypothetical protein
MYEGEISDIGVDFFDIRIYGRNPNKMEYDSVPLANSKYDKHIKQGWYSLSLNSLTNNKIRVFCRSTDIEKISFEKIDSIKYRKKEKDNNEMLELLIFGGGLITSPLWNYNKNDKKFNWTTFGVLAGVVCIDVIIAMVKENRHKLRTYNFNDWKVKKIK